jgi:hypothetical protein
MRTTTPILFGLAFLSACNPSGVEEASGEAEVVDATAEVVEADASVLDTIIADLTAKACERKVAEAGGEADKVTTLDAELGALAGKATEEMEKGMTPEEIEALKAEKLMPAYRGENCP